MFVSVSERKAAVHTFSHIGQRDENQDRFLVLDSSDDGSSLFVVADGLGGHSGGELAAQTVVDTARRMWTGCFGDADGEAFLRQFAGESHAAVQLVGREHNLDPHSTLVGLLLTNAGAMSIHAGDSRVMQFSDTGLVARTLDHSMAQRLALRGTITEEEMATHPAQAVLYSHVGGIGSTEVEINHWNLSEGARFVVCSDGFWEIFPPGEMLELFACNDPSTEIELRLERMLKRLGHHDNTTAILIDIIPSEP